MAQTPLGGRVEQPVRHFDSGPMRHRSQATQTSRQGG